jgi:hypothetical protein
MTSAAGLADRFRRRWLEPVTPAEAVTLGCTRQAAAGEPDGLDMERSEYTVTAT